MLKINNSSVSANPFLCGVCSLGFADEESLKDHVLQHEDNICENNNSIKINEDNFDQYVINDSIHRFVFSNDFQHQLHTNSNGRFKRDENNTPFCDRNDFNVSNVPGSRRNDFDLANDASNGIWQAREPIFDARSAILACESLLQSNTTNQSIINQNTKEVLYCPECTQTFKDMVSLNKHVERKHIIARPFICHECGDSFAQRSTLSRHKMTHTGARPFNCPQCPKAFPTNSELREHLRTHSEVKTYVCPQCEKRFCHRASLRTHMKYHDDFWKEKMFSCEQCEKKFLTHSMLKEHKKIHLDYKPFECQICSHRFRSNSSLLRHEHTHYKNQLIPDESRQQRTFHCTECSKTFYVKYDLQRHTAAVHLNLKDFKCSICDKAFIHKGALNRHIRTHTGEKPFSCDQCDKTFGDSSGLRCHKRVHSGIKPYKCKLCGEIYSQSTSLKNHRLRVHPEVFKPTV